MAGAIRLVSIERGHNPRDFMLMPFGGGGALHAGALVSEVGLKGALVPRFPGVTSALGCVIADMRHDFVLTLNRLLDDLDEDALASEIARLAGEGRALLDRSGVTFTGRDTEVALDMLYVGQTHTVTVPLPAGGGQARRETIRAAFDQRYREVFGRLLEGIPLRVMNLHVAVIGRRPKLDLAMLAPAGGSVEEARRGIRRVYVGSGWVDTPIFERGALPVGAVLTGPAILEQDDATIFVEPDFSLRVDRCGNVILEPREA
jgi:N-methylhydantoinase A